MQQDAAPDDDTGGLVRDGEHDEVEARKAGSARVIHEVIRRQGEEELARPALSLAFSGVVAGVAMGASVLAKTYLHAGLPDAPWRNLVESLGYTLGFVIVVMGRMQLFTENTVTAVLPVATHPGIAQIGRLLRLWGIVFAANMAGTLLVAAMLARTSLLTPPEQAALFGIARDIAIQPWPRVLLLGIPSGFLIGCLAWILPNNREAQIWVIIALTWLIGIGHFSHVVAGSIEAWALWLMGGATLSQAMFAMILPSLVGNIIGGSFLFAVLAHGQVRSEIE